MESLVFFNKYGLTRNLTIHEKKFMKFVRFTRKPFTQKKIIKYWRDNIAKDGGKGIWMDRFNYKKRCWEFVFEEYSKKHIQKLANDWFDRWAGKFFRLGLIENQIVNNL